MKEVINLETINSHTVNLIEPIFGLISGSLTFQVYIKIY